MTVPDWIVDEKFRQRAADTYGPRNKPEVVQPIEAVIFHYTGPGSERGLRGWLTAEDEHFVSCHFIVDRGGTTWQLISLNERGAHAGGATSRFLGRQNVNGRTIGVEVANVGPVSIGAGGRWEDSAGRPFTGALFDAGAVARGKSRYWEAFPAAQVEALLGLARRLSQVFPALTDEPELRLVGHEDVDPSRKTDPGPAFPWSLVRAAVGAK